MLLAAVSLALTTGLRAQSTAPTATLTTLKAFGSIVGTNPEAAPIQGADGALYGVTSGGGANNDGTIYRRAADGTFTVLHDFVAATMAAARWPNWSRHRTVFSTAPRVRAGFSAAARFSRFPPTERLSWSCTTSTTPPTGPTPRRRSRWVRTA